MLLEMARNAAIRGGGDKMLALGIRRTLMCAAGTLLAGLTPVSAGTISIAWDAVADASGYRVYYSTTSGSFSDAQSIDVGNVLGTTVNGLTDCTTWYLAVKAYNSAGSSPNFSNEITGYARPTLSGAPVAVMQGDQLLIDITGTNFETGATVEIDNPYILIQSATSLSCTRFQFLATVEPIAQDARPAQIGDFDVTIVNPDDVFGTGSDKFEVLVNPARFDINQSDDSTRGRLDGKDTVWLSRVFGGQEGNPLYDPNSDFNGDGWVDGDDLSYVASNLGSCWTGTAWSAGACTVN